MVLWGTDNLKNEGGPIAQALALMGAAPRFDSYGRLAGAALMPLAELGRPRIDVVITLSGIFRDLLPLQIKLLAEAAFLAAGADEPLEQNFVRKHALAYQARARLRPRDRGAARLRQCRGRLRRQRQPAWSTAAAGTTRTSWPRPTPGARASPTAAAAAPVQQPALLQSVLADVELAYQNLDSVELGVTTVDHYFDTLGGISRAVKRAKRRARQRRRAPVYIGDQTRGDRRACARCASRWRWRPAPACSTRNGTKRMLEHGYEGVRQIEAHVTNTLGWSATTGQVQPWVYQQLTETFVLDAAMRERLAQLNPTASAKVANRLLEAHEPPATGSPMPTRSTRCDAPAKNSKTASKASSLTGRQQHDRSRHHRPSAIRRGPRPAALDGEGSVQVQLDPQRQDRHRQGVRRSTARAASARAPRRATCRPRSPSSASACCRSAATPSTTAPSR